MAHILLIDGNNIGYASMYVPALARMSHNGLHTGGIMGLAQSVMRIAKLFPGAVPVVLWDGHAAWRKELCPEYKENRKDTPEKRAVAEAWRQQQPWASALLMQMGVMQMRAPDAEADDLAGRLCMNLAALSEYHIERVTMISGDTDWWQAISENVDWFTPITDKRMTLEMLGTEAAKDGPFLGPDEYLLAKAVAGDHSDNIAGVPGVGIATAVKLLRLHGGLDGIQQAVASGVAKDKKSSTIASMRETVERNRSIMDWRMSPPSREAASIIRFSFEPKECRALCEEFGLDRLSGRLSEDGLWAEISQGLEMPAAQAINYCEAVAYSAWIVGIGNLISGGKLGANP